MKLTPLALAVALMAPALVYAKSPHSFRGSVAAQGRSNTNISLAPSSNSGFNFASLKDFEEAEEEAEADSEDEDEDEAEDDDFGDIPDIEGSDYDELELAESDNPDEDGDGVDDLIDDDQDTGDGDDEGDDEDDGDDDDDGSIGKGAKKSKTSKVERFTGKLGLAHKYKVSKTANYLSSVKLSFDKQPGRSELDKLNLALSTGPEFKLSDAVKVKTAINYVRLQQDSERFLSTFVGSVGLDWEVNKKFALGFDYNYQDKDVTDPDSPDAIINTLTFNADWSVSENDIVKLKYSPSVEDSSITTRNKDTSGFEITYSRKLPWKTVLGIGYKYDEVDYEKLPTPRSDEIDSFGIQLETEFSDTMSGSLAFDQRKLDSNINSKDGKNRSVVLGFEYKF